mmetsp:Transcript_36842/g.76948  ORF Transcript_36842/g.76948 Transcript_36842/m.76948 type:complete len:217 (-) Transcript_36842:37-687(-)
MPRSTVATGGAEGGPGQPACLAAHGLLGPAGPATRACGPTRHRTALLQRQQHGAVSRWSSLPHCPRCSLAPLCRTGLEEMALRRCAACAAQLPSRAVPTPVRVHLAGWSGPGRSHDGALHSRPEPKHPSWPRPTRRPQQPSSTCVRLRAAGEMQSSRQIADSQCYIADCRTPFTIYTTPNINESAPVYISPPGPTPAAALYANFARFMLSRKLSLF